MKMNSFNLYLAAIVLIQMSFGGCKNFAVSTKEDPTCPTSVSGYMHYPIIYSFKTPALIIKKGGSYKVLRGTIGKKTDEGYIFDADKADNWDDPPKLYKFDDITCLLDSGANILHGMVPEKFLVSWNLEVGLVPSNDPDKKPVILRIKHDQPFSYCLAPGSYIVKYIEFVKREGYTDISETLPFIRLEVAARTNNYIGDLYFDEKESNFNITCRPGERPSDAMAGQFGLMGGLMSAAAKAAEKDKLHNINIKNELPGDDKRKVSLMTIEK